MSTGRYSKRAALSAGVSFAALAVACLGGTASAADFTAGDEAALRKALTDANNSSDAASTITLTGSFSVTVLPLLPTSNKSITIKTQGFTLSGQGVPGNLASISFSGAFPNGHSPSMVPSAEETSRGPYRLERASPSTAR